RPLYAFYRFEQRYHEQVMSKYQHFLPFLGDAAQWYEQQEEVAAYGQRLLSLMALRQDASLQRMKDAERAEQMGRDIYDQPGGRYLTEGRAGRAVLDSRVAAMKQVYGQKLDDLRSELASSGLVLQVGPQPEDQQEQQEDQHEGAGVGGDDEQAQEVSAELRIVPGGGHEFDEVKALDLHHLGYDCV